MTPRLRLAALLAAAAALWFAREAMQSPPVAAASRPAAPRAATQAVAAAAEICTVPTALPVRGVLADHAGADPFALAPVAAPPAPPPPVLPAPAPPPPVAVSAPAPPPPPPAPKLPFRFYGMAKERGEAASVFLALGNTLIHAKAGDVLEGGWRLDTIGPRELSFTQPQQNLTLKMSVDGETSWP